MEVLTELLQNASGGYDMGSMFTLFCFMLALDGMVLTIYAIFKGFR